MSAYNNSKATSRKQWRALILVGGGLLVLVMMVLFMTTKAQVNPNLVKKAKIKTPLRTITPEETWRAKSEQVLAEMKKSIAGLKAKRKVDHQKLVELRKELKQKRHQLAKIPAQRSVAKKKNIPFSVLKPPIQTKYQKDRGNQLRQVNAGRSGIPSQLKAVRQKSLQPVAFAPLEIVEDIITKPLSKVTKKKARGKTVKNYMPAGTFMEGVLLSGLDAPSGVQTSGNPVPALVQITDYGMLPNDWKKDIKKCRVTVEGFGDLASERAYLRTLFLSCVRHNGVVIEVALKAYVSGEDGKTGLRGRVVSKQGRMIAKSIWAGTIAGLGGALTNRYSTTLTSPLGSVTTVDGKDSLKQGLSGGVGKALDRVANYYLKQAERVYPVIEIGAGRKVTIILQKGVWLKKKNINAQTRTATRPTPQRVAPPRSQKVYRTQYNRAQQQRR